ncbi:phosphotransferase [Thalassomonas viridans]|uniref:Phosphotransferase n=1 Tax=Thalassomonas viridans TaxID=137584 RepID=A0AAE9YYK5_9GAMM|nr:aminoglycoside 3'-phosphotransferase/choline kinase family protein [Thalassomonas viridans]WDE03596.1 phosphotransferase [Thalassomonas viridans]
MEFVFQALPVDPGYEQSCDLVDNSPDEFWQPLLEHLKEKHQLPDGSWQRIRTGANVLFSLDDQLVLKIVPPNWGYQGQAEIDSCSLLGRQLSVAIPEVVASGTVNNWLYVVMTKLPGTSLADVWQDLGHSDKLVLVKQLGSFIRELHQLTLPDDHQMKVNWADYIDKLKQDCLPRHKRKGVDESLVAQIEAYLSGQALVFDDGTDLFIHMDLHPWNLMVQHKEGQYRLSGVLDFGDAIVGRSRLLELLTPLLFMCQGDKALALALLKSYSLLDVDDKEVLRQQLMAIALLRPACDFKFVLSQVPQTGDRDNWQQISRQLFPF